MLMTAGTLKPALSMSSQAKVQSQPRPRPRWGNGRSRAQWNMRPQALPLPATKYGLPIRFLDNFIQETVTLVA